MRSILAVVTLFGRAAAAICADALAPNGCAACDARAGTAIFCPPCAASVVRASGRASAARRRRVLAFGAYGGALATALRRLKYCDRADLARPLADLLRLLAREHALEADLVVPVPLHALRLCERGYNQAALLARPLARDLGAPVAPTALERIRHGPPQARLGAADRARIATSFRVRDPRRVRGRRVLLVDDVVTTGATLEACAAALTAAGARAVRALVVAAKE
jgi:ComF family protein